MDPILISGNTLSLESPCKKLDFCLTDRYWMIQTKSGQQLLQKISKAPVGFP